VWANERVLEACAALTPAQLTTPVPGTYGPIIDTLRHLVQADSFYLWIFADQAIPLIPSENDLDVAALRAANTKHAAGYRELLAGTLDPDTEVVERGDGWATHATMGIRLAQATHHGSDHRSQVCTALTGLGLTPPDIDVWAYGHTVGRTRDVTAPAR
jgi:uncharacterized damage-inducible protein DinB